MIKLKKLSRGKEKVLKDRNDNNLLYEKSEYLNIRCRSKI